jgi:hypothetical protein
MTHSPGTSIGFQSLPNAPRSQKRSSGDVLNNHVPASPTRSFSILEDNGDKRGTTVSAKDKKRMAIKKTKILNDLMVCLLLILYAKILKLA